MNIGFIGTGNMGGALAAAAARAAAGNGRLGGRILLCDNDSAKAGALAARIGGEVVTLDEIFAAADIIFFGVKPQGLRALADESAALLAARISGGRTPLAVTMAAGVELDKFSGYFPGIPAIRIMPNTPVSVGEGMIFWCAGDGVSDAARGDFLAVMSCAGRLCELPEKQIDAAARFLGADLRSFICSSTHLPTAGSRRGSRAALHARRRCRPFSVRRRLHVKPESTPES